MKTKSKTNYIPEGFHTVTPYLTVRNAMEAIDFYKRAFGAQQLLLVPMPDGKIGHAELQIGDSIFMLREENSEHGHDSPETLDGSPVSFALYVQKVDEAFARAVEAGASVKERVEDKFWGDRAGCVSDPFGHQWSLLTHIEDVSPEEMKRRTAEIYAMALADNKK